MDPAAVTAHVVREVARDGNFGAHAHDVWKFAAQAANQPLDDALKDSVWLWLAQHPSIHIGNARAYASEELQWLELTGGPKQGSIVPQLAFNVLCAVAHSREAGISTVDVAKQVGQDPRSLFGRVQLLTDLGFVQRFPVIEKGSSTHRIVLTPYVAHHIQGQSASNPFIDKQAARKQIVEFCKTGPQGLRLKRDVVSQIGNSLTSNSQRRRPLVISLLKDLEQRGFVRSIQVYDPAAPTKAYACVQFARDYDDGALEKRTNSAWTDVTVESGDVMDADDAVADDVESQVQEATERNDEPLDLSRAVAGDSSAPREGAQANIAMPLVNQIHDLIFASGSQGISAMEITRKLTGRSYSKAMGKFLDALTGDTRSKAPSITQPRELGHLSLIKGVDFAQRVKFYRYFTRTTYPGSVIDDIWGSFSSSPSVRDPKLSLKILDAQSRLPLPGGCSIIETQDGKIKPVFHGEKTTTGKILLVSDPSRTTVTSATPVKRRGRPPKNAPRPPPEPSRQEKPSTARSIHSVSLGDRKWTGGQDHRLVSDSPNMTRPAVWLRQDTHSPTTGTNRERGASETLPRGLTTSASSNGVVESLSLDVKKESPELPTTNTKSLGSLAFARRLEVLRGLIKDNSGAVIGGQDLVDRFNAAVNGDSLVDRKTIERVTKNLIKEGTLRQIFVNVPTMTGIHLMKYILYDPEIIENADESPLIAKLKHELNDRTRVKQSAAAKAVAGNHRLNDLAGVRQEMTVDQARAFRPLLGQRLATTTSSRKKPVATRRFGVSASEVAGAVNPSGEPKRSKRGKKSSLIGDLALEKIRVPQHYGSVVADTRKAAKKRSAPPKELSVSDIDRDWLFRAAVVSRSLFPRGRGIDWSLVAQSAPFDVSEKLLKQRWTSISSDFPGGTAEMARRSNEWEDLFATAYAADEIVYLKPTDHGFTLQYYMDWWRVAEQSLMTSSSSRKQASGRGRLRDLSFKSRDFASRLADPLSSLQSQPSMIKAEELLVKTILGVALDADARESKPTLKLSDSAAKLRAVVAADNGATFSAKEAMRELEKVDEEAAKQALHELERHKYIQWATPDPEKIPVGRPYVLSEKVMNMLAPPAKWESDLPSKSAQAVSTLCEGGELEVPETVDESQMIPLLEMATFGLNGQMVQLERSGERSGRLSNHYRSRDIDKNELDCDIRAKVSEGGDPQSDTFVEPHKIHPPKLRNNEHPAIWQTSRLSSQNIWNTVAFKILATVLFRPGISCEALSQSLRHVLEKEETFAAIDALVDGQALLSKNGGLIAQPDWFAYIS